MKTETARNLTPADINNACEIMDAAIRRILKSPVKQKAFEAWKEQQNEKKKH